MRGAAAASERRLSKERAGREKPLARDQVQSHDDEATPTAARVGGSGASPSRVPLGFMGREDEVDEQRGICEPRCALLVDGGATVVRRRCCLIGLTGGAGSCVFQRSVAAVCGFCA